MRHMSKQTENRIVELLIALILLTAFGGLIYLYPYLNTSSNNGKQWELGIQAYGAFVATLFGVYISLHLSKIQEHERDERAMLGSLKTIWSELDINGDILAQIYSGLQNMPRIPSQLSSQQNLLITHAKGLQDRAFYATLSSGAMNVISMHNDIFNDLQQAYYNTQSAQIGLSSTNEIYEDLAKNAVFAQDPFMTNVAFNMIEKESYKFERTIAMVTKAKKSTFDYLTSKGVIFSRDEEQKQKESDRPTQIPASQPAQSST